MCHDTWHKCKCHGKSHYYGGSLTTVEIVNVIEFNNFSSSAFRQYQAKALVLEFYCLSLLTSPCSLYHVLTRTYIQSISWFKPKTNAASCTYIINLVIYFFHPQFSSKWLNFPLNIKLRSGYINKSFIKSNQNAVVPKCMIPKYRGAMASNRCSTKIPQYWNAMTWHQNTMAPKYCGTKMLWNKNAIPWH